MALLSGKLVILSSLVQLSIGSAACRHLCSRPATQQRFVCNSHEATASRKANYYPAAVILDLADSLWKQVKTSRA